MAKASGLMRPDQERKSLAGWLLDERVLQMITQVIFGAAILGVAYYLYHNMTVALAKEGMVVGYDFLKKVSGFDISFKLIPFDRTSTYFRALEVGVLNTLLASIISIIISTVLGIVVAVARVSSHWLLNRLAWLYIEIFRNVPLLLVIMACYAVYIFNLPNVNKADVLPGPSYLSNRGLVIPRLTPTPLTFTFLTLLFISLLVSIAAAYLISRRFRLDRFIGTLIALGITVLLGVVIWFLLPQAGFGVDIPAKTGLNFTGGTTLPPELVGIIMGLVLGSSPFTADTIRAGLQSVSKGQIEAARALGLSGYQTMRLVIFPQAMRVIVPPMTSNYMSLTKNSSLASAIAFPELVHVTTTLTAQTGRAVETTTIMMVVYATLSLLTSLFMNWYNQRVKIVER